MNRKTPFQLYLEPGERDALRAQALRDGRSMAGTLRHALREYIAAEELRREARKLGVKIP